MHMLHRRDQLFAGKGGHVRANAAPDAVPEAPDEDFEERWPDFDFEADTEID